MKQKYRNKMAKRKLCAFTIIDPVSSKIEICTILEDNVSSKKIS